MKKIKYCLLSCTALLVTSIAFSQASTDKELFTKKVTYKLSGARNAAIARYKVEAFKNTIKIFSDGKLLSELGLSKPKPGGGGPGPLPPGPNPCAPGRCYPITFSMDDKMIVASINGVKSSLIVTELRGGKAFADVINQSPSKQIIISDAQF